MPIWMQMFLAEPFQTQKKKQTQINLDFRGALELQMGRFDITFPLESQDVSGMTNEAEE